MTQRVLIVEDDDLQAMAYTIALQRAGLVPTVAGSLRAARTLLAREEFRAVILDYELPDGTSDTLLPGGGSGLPVPTIVASGTAPGLVRQAFRDRGVDLILHKNELQEMGVSGALLRAAERRLRRAA